MKIITKIKFFLKKPEIWQAKRKELKLNKKKSKKLILFFLPRELDSISGGLLSIRNIFEETRNIKLQEETNVFCSFLPGIKSKYYKYSQFENDLVIFNFKEMTAQFPDLECLEVHIPEFFIFLFNQDNPKFYFLECWIKKIAHVKLNVMNQNDVLMPDIKIFNMLFNITKNITITVAHQKYATMQKRNFYNVPIHLIKPYNSLTPFSFREFHDKENLIVVSHDEIDPLIYETNITKKEVLDKLEKELPDFSIIIIQNITYDFYKDLIARAKFAITFGEGFDAYFSEPFLSGSVAFAVQNDIFFPNDFKKLQSVYQTFDQLIARIKNDIDNFCLNPATYTAYNFEVKTKLEDICSPVIFKNCLLEYFKGNYDFK